MTQDIIRDVGVKYLSLTKVMVATSKFGDFGERHNHCFAHFNGVAALQMADVCLGIIHEYLINWIQSDL